MTNMSIQPLWLTHFIEILSVFEFQLTKFSVGTFSYKAHFRPQNSSNVAIYEMELETHGHVQIGNQLGFHEHHFAWVDK